MEYTTISPAGGTTTLTVSTLCLGTMRFGSETAEDTAIEVLDAFREAGGTFLDTANNYNSWTGGTGRESEDILGRWLAARGARDEMVLATKCGAGQRDRTRPAGGTNFEGLAPAVVRAEAERSLRALGTDRLDVYYAHIDDRETPMADVAGVFGELATAGKIGVAGVSNISAWRLAQYRDEAARLGVPGFSVVQQHGSYLFPRPSGGSPWVRRITPELLDYASTADDLTVVAYSPLLQGAYRDPARLDETMDHAGNHHRIEELRKVAADLGATPHQVVLAYLIGGPVPVIPIFGASSVAQLKESLGAVDLVLDADTRERLDRA